MQLVRHRVNDVSSLMTLPEHYGVELDLQYSNSEISIGHNPGQISNSFDDYLRSYKHSLMCLNIKQEGIEESVIEKLESQNISHFFLFDLTFPAIMKLIRLKKNCMALRLSDFESIRDLKYFIGKVQWIWLDTFTDINFISRKSLEVFEGFKICLVSPELHTWRSEEFNYELTKKLLDLDFAFDAVCTKNLDIWQNAQ